MKKSASLSFLTVLFRILYCVLSAYILYNILIYTVYFITVKSMSQVKMEDYLMVMIYGSSSENDTVSARFSIIDSNGNDIAAIERSWSGSYLEVEFDYVTFKDKTFYFPSQIYGKHHIFGKNETRKAASLEKYYDENNQCLILGYGSALKDRKKMYFLSKFANKKLGVIQFGLVKKYLIDLSNCENGIFYSISVNDENKISIYKL